MQKEDERSVRAEAPADEHDWTYADAAKRALGFNGRMTEKGR
jgi:hypothetical protein